MTFATGLPFASVTRPSTEPWAKAPVINRTIAANAGMRTFICHTVSRIVTHLEMESETNWMQATIACGACEIAIATREVKRVERLVKCLERVKHATYAAWYTRSPLFAAPRP